eukprot:1157925-Pelagomonas_calceolata.AAC.7
MHHGRGAAAAPGTAAAVGAPDTGTAGGDGLRQLGARRGGQTWCKSCFKVTGVLHIFIRKAQQRGCTPVPVPVDVLCAKPGLEMDRDVGQWTDRFIVSVLPPKPLHNARSQGNMY